MSQISSAGFISGYSYEPYFVEGSDPASMHQAMAATLEHCIREIRRIQQEARRSVSEVKRPLWPMVILRSPKGWTGPKEIDGHKVEGFWPAHQVPMAEMHENPAHLALLEEWLRGYQPQELFDDAGRLLPELRELAPRGERRMGANPLANGVFAGRQFFEPATSRGIVVGAGVHDSIGRIVVR